MYMRSDLEWTRDHPYITSVLDGWVQKLAVFAAVQHCIYAEKVLGKVEKI